MTRFIDNGDDTVTDSKTGLIWTKATISEGVTYDKALAALGEGFRLPTDEELLSLVDRTRHSPAIDTDAFPDTYDDWYWTSTPCAWNDAAVWVVVFGNGIVSYNHRKHHGCVRAVRSGQ